MKRKLGDLILVSVFIIFISTFGIGTMITPDEKKSTLENRKLQQFPELTLNSVLSGDYFEEFTAYVNDQFLLRKKWIETDSKIEKKVLKKRVVNDIYMSKDGYLLEPINKVKQSPENIADKINTFAEKMKDKNIGVYFALAPHKTVMMEEKLPHYLKSKGNKLSDALMQNFSADVKAIDLRSIIKKHMDESDMYFRTDHHWEPKSAYYGYTAIINKMAHSDSNIGEPIAKDRFTWKKTEKPFYGSYARKAGKAYVKEPDDIPLVKPKFKEKPYKICYSGSCDQGFYATEYLEKDKMYTNRYKVYLGGSLPKVTIKNHNKPKGEKLLILKDSYAHATIPFLARHFKEIHMLDLRHTDKNVFQYIKQHDIDNVLFIHNIETLVKNSEVVTFKKE